MRRPAGTDIILVMKIGIVACRVMKRELEACAAGAEAEIHSIFLEQGLHRTPKIMTPRIQEAVDSLPDGCDFVALGYGLCSNGVVGVVSKRAPLVVPKVDDCIGIFLGSYERYLREFWKEPGTYWLTGGWIEEDRSPMGLYEEYRERLGEKAALWYIHEAYKNYKRVVYLHTGVWDRKKYSAIARENARFLGLRYEEMEGSLEYLKKLVSGRYGGGEFLIFEPGQPVRQAPFLEGRPEPPGEGVGG